MEIKQSQFRCRLLSTKNRWNYTYDQTVDAHKMKVFTKHFYAFHFAVFFFEICTFVACDYTQDPTAMNIWHKRRKSM